MTPTYLSPSGQARRYLAVFFSLLGLGLAVIVALNLTADPFRVFGARRLAGINERPPDVSGFDRMAKPYEILRVRPRTVLMGSSTANSGFLGLNDWETGLAKPVFNYALLGANIHEVGLSLAQALRENPIENVILVADFFGYNVHYSDNESFNLERLAAASRKDWLGFTVADLGSFTLGIDSLKMSWSTLRDSRRAVNKGSIGLSTPAPSQKFLVHFQNCERSYLHKWFPPPARRYDFADSSGRDRFADFDAALRLCAEKGVRVIVIIPPVHARFHEAMATAGAWAHYETFKRELTRHVRGGSSRFAAKGGPRPLELWDFSLFSKRTEEVVPPDGGTPMKWWHDSAHFTSDFGLDIMNEIQNGLAAGAQPLGVRLLPETVAIDAHLDSLRAGLAAFREAQPDVAADVRAALGIATPPPLLP